MDVVRPRTLDEALRLKADLDPESRFIQGGTDVMVELNFDHSRPPALIDLNAVSELRGGTATTERWCSAPASPTPRRWSRSSRVSFPPLPWPHARSAPRRSATEAPSAATSALPRPRATRSPRFSSKRRWSRSQACAELGRFRSRRSSSGSSATRSSMTSSSPRSDSHRGAAPQTFMKVGTRNAMVISVCSLALQVDSERGEVRAAFGSAAPVPTLVRVPLAEADSVAERVVAAARPIDDVRGTAAYRRHALGVLATRALGRCLK